MRNPQMTTWPRLLIFALCTALLAGSVSYPAARAADQPQFEQVVLSRDLVTRFLASFPKFRALGKKYKKTRPGDGSDTDDPASSLSGYLTNTAARIEMESLVKAHGFSSIQEWLDVARSTAVAYGFVKSGKTPQQLGQQAEQALAAIRGNQRLTPEQKQQMEGMVRQQLGRLKRYEPLPENLAVAKDMLNQIAAVMDTE